MSRPIEEEQVRQEMGLSKSRRKPAPVPVPSIRPKGETIIDVEAEMKKHPQLRYYVEGDRHRGFSENTIRNMLPTYMKTLGLEPFEDRIAREMGMPREKERPAEQSALENRVRKAILGKGSAKVRRI